MTEVKKDDVIKILHTYPLCRVSISSHYKYNKLLIKYTMMYMGNLDRNNKINIKFLSFYLMKINFD